MIINYTDTKKEDLIKFKPKAEIDVEAKVNELAERGIYVDLYNSKGELVASSKKKKKTITSDNLYTGDPYSVGNSTSKSNDFSQLLPTVQESGKKKSSSNTMLPTGSPGTIDANNIGKITSQATQGTSNKGNSSSWQNQDKLVFPTGEKTTKNDSYTDPVSGLKITYPPYMTKKKKNGTSRAGLARQNVTNILKQAKGNTNDVSHIFDGIDDDAIERNFPFAEEAVALSKTRNAYGADDNPYKTDALAIMYAADDLGLSDAAKAAKEAAYARNLKATSETPQTGTLLLKAGNTPELTKFANIGAKASKDDKNNGGFWNIVKSGIDEITSNMDMPIKDAIENISDAFTGEDKLLSGISAVYDTLRALNIPGSKVAKNIARDIWNTGAELYLRNYKKYDVSADLLEHSLQENPEDLVFYDDSRIAQKIKEDKVFLNDLDKVVYKIENNIPLEENDRWHEFNDGDLFYSLHGCSFAVKGIKYNKDGTKNIRLHIKDTYDYTKIDTLMGKGINIGTVANDFATLTTMIDAINIYKIDIYVTVTR